MTEETISALLSLAIGFTLVVWPRRIATYFSGITKELRRDENDVLARGLEACWRATEKVFFTKVNDEATAPTVVRFIGFIYLLIGLCVWIVLG
jgi:hypothetical protein